MCCAWAWLADTVLKGGGRRFVARGGVLRLSGSRGGVRAGGVSSNETPTFEAYQLFVMYFCLFPHGRGEMRAAASTPTTVRSHGRSLSPLRVGN